MLQRKRSAIMGDREHGDPSTAEWEKSEFRDIFLPFTSKLKSSTESTRETAALWDICPGCILWLPLEYNPLKSAVPMRPPRRVLEHPVVVLNISVSGPEDAIITFAVMRSFKAGGFDESRPGFWKRHLKIVKPASQETRLGRRVRIGSSVLGNCFLFNVQVLVLDLDG